MNCKSLVAIALLAGCGPVLANPQIAPVQVTSKPVFALEFSCASPAAASRADVEKMLKINDATQTRALSGKLMGAVGEACNAGVENIEVRRGANGQSLTWAPARANASYAVALN